MDKSAFVWHFWERLCWQVFFSKFYGGSFGVFFEITYKVSRVFKAQISPNLFNGKFNIVHPEVEENLKQEGQIGPSLTGVYATTEKCKARGLDSKAILRLQRTILSAMPSTIPETLSQTIIQQKKLLPIREALVNIHIPTDDRLLSAATYRLKFEELFYVQLRLLKAKAARTDQYKGKLINGKIKITINMKPIARLSLII